MEDDLDAVALLQPRDGDLDVELRGPGEVELLGLVVPLEVERGVFLDQLVQRGRDLVFVALGLRLDGVRDRGLGHGQRRQDDRVVLGGDGVAREGLLELRDGHDVAGVGLGDADVLLPLRQEEARETLVGRSAWRSSSCRRTGSVPRGPGGTRCVPANGSDTVLKTWATAWSFSLQKTTTGLPSLPTPSSRAALGRGEERDAGVEDPDRADSGRGRGAEDGEDLALDDLALQTRQDVLRLERALREELLHEVVFALGDRLDERLVLGLRPVGQLRRDRAVHALASLVDVRLHADEVDGSPERLLFADRNLERHDAAPEFLAQRLDDAVERGALAVHPVDDEEHRALELRGELPGPLGLDLDARDGVENEERRRRRRARRPGPPERRCRSRERRGS